MKFHFIFFFFFFFVWFSMDEQLVQAVQQIELAKDFEEQKRFSKALDNYTLAIKYLLDSSKKCLIFFKYYSFYNLFFLLFPIILFIGDISMYNKIRECVDSVLTRSDYIRRHIDWQEDLDQSKESYLQHERLFTDYSDRNLDIFTKQLSVPYPYEPPPTYNEAIASLVHSELNQEDITQTELYTEFSSESSLSDEILIRPYIRPPEFINLPIKPVPPVTYTISRSFSKTDARLLRTKSLRAQQLMVKRKSILTGKSTMELNRINKYMLSTGIRTSIVEMMGNNMYDSWKLHQQKECEESL